MGTVQSLATRNCNSVKIDGNYDTCPLYDVHRERMVFIDKFGRVLEKYIYERFNVTLEYGNEGRISWFQLVGQILKLWSNSMPNSNPLKQNLGLNGRSQKLIGQMENELCIVMNHLILEPIQLCRLQDSKLILPLYEKLLVKSQKLDENDEKLISTHEKLHQYIIDTHTLLTRIQTRIYAILQFQGQFFNYGYHYIENLLHDMENNKNTSKFCQDFKTFQSIILPHPQDYRPLLNDPGFYLEETVLTNKFNSKKAEPNTISEVSTSRQSTFEQSSKYKSKVSNKTKPDISIRKQRAIEKFDVKPTPESEINPASVSEVKTAQNTERKNTEKSVSEIKTVQTAEKQNTERKNTEKSVSEIKTVQTAEKQNTEKYIDPYGGYMNNKNTPGPIVEIENDEKYIDPYGGYKQNKNTANINNLENKNQLFFKDSIINENNNYNDDINETDDGDNDSDDLDINKITEEWVNDINRNKSCPLENCESFLPLIKQKSYSIIDSDDESLKSVIANFKKRFSSLKTLINENNNDN